MVINDKITPTIQAPLSPKKILELGKLKKSIERRVEIKNKIKFCRNILLLLKISTKYNAPRIISVCKINKPLKPSIKLEPFVINNKHKQTKMIEQNLL